MQGVLSSPRMVAPVRVWLLVAAAITARAPDAALADMKTPAEMAAEHGFPSEFYSVLTKDGYYVRLDRIANPGKPAVFISNAILSSGSMYLHMGPDYSLGYALHKAGFDVFLGNDRGTYYSQNLTETLSNKISPKSDEYFHFSWHEHAVQDNPAFIKKILEVTGQPHLSYIGLSMGGCEFFAMVSEMPAMNKIIKSAHIIAPVMALGEHRTHLYEILHPAHNVTAALLDTIGYHRVPENLFKILTKAFCPNFTGSLCNEALFFVFQSARAVDYVGNCPDLASTWPSGGSFREFLHCAQNTRYEGRFKKYDHGEVKNQMLYGHSTPSDYNMEVITVPVHVYRGRGDPLVSDADLLMIGSRVPGFVEEWTHPDPTFSHADFVWARDAVIANQKIIQDLRQYLH